MPGVTETVTVRPAAASDEAAVTALLRSHHGLEAVFAPGEFVVADAQGWPVGCARMRPCAGGGWELASVATRPGLQGRGIGSRLVGHALAGRDGPVYALALAPGFFARFGFEPVALGDMPPDVRAKAEGMCASRPYVAMRLGARPWQASPPRP
jgi:N-acetylglutamate synthase-like GNAT family acetyltransferase